MSITPQKLTKKFFLGLREFDFLVSGVCGAGPRNPLFAAHVDPPEKRKDQWKQIVAAGASQRNCFIFINQQQYLNFLNRFAPKQPLPSQT